MIISHKYKFIFIKTAKTAGTSIEVFLSKYCSDDDIITPIFPPIEGHIARNYRGYFNPFPELIDSRKGGYKKTISDFFTRKHFWNHMPARVIKNRVPGKIWNNYYKFCVERNPWDKTLSKYWMQYKRSNEALTLEEFFQIARFPRYFAWYTDDDKKLMVDKVVKFENLSGDLGDVFEKLGIPFSGDLGVRAKSDFKKDRRSYKDIFTKEQADIIGNVFKDEISMHGYEF